MNSAKKNIEADILSSYPLTVAKGSDSPEKPIKINLSAIGDTKNPSTWSGTPYNIYSELLKRSMLAKAFDSGVSNKFLIKVAKVISKICFDFKSNYYRSYPYRLLMAIKVYKNIRKSGTKHTLHFSTYDMPILGTFGQKHYLFCDTTWDLWACKMLEVSQFTKRMQKHLDLLEKKCYDKATHIFPISNYVKQNLIDHYKVSPDKITVVGTGRGKILPFFGEKDYSNHKVLFVAKGRFEDKGGPEVIESFTKAVKINPKLSLTIVGQDSLINKYNIPNLHIYGFVDDTTLQDLFDTHSVFLMPAVNEPWGLVYLEALACRMPIVGLNSNSFPEICAYGKYGYILKNNNVDETTDLLIKLFQNPAELKQKGELGQEYCLKNFGWEITTDKMIKVITAHKEEFLW